MMVKEWFKKKLEKEEDKERIVDKSKDWLLHQMVH